MISHHDVLRLWAYFLFFISSWDRASMALETRENRGWLWQDGYHRNNNHTLTAKVIIRLHEFFEIRTPSLNSNSRDLLTSLLYSMYIRHFLKCYLKHFIQQTEFNKRRRIFGANIQERVVDKRDMKNIRGAFVPTPCLGAGVLHKGVFVFAIVISYKNLNCRASPPGLRVAVGPDFRL